MPERNVSLVSASRRNDVEPVSHGAEMTYTHIIVRRVWVSWQWM